MADEKKKPDHKIQWIEGIEGVVVKPKPKPKPPSLLPGLVMTLLAVVAAAPKQASKMALVPDITINESFNDYDIASSVEVVPDVSTQVFDPGSLLTVSGDYEVDPDGRFVDLDLAVRNGAKKNSFSNVVLRARYYNEAGRQIWHQDVYLSDKFKARKTRKVRQRINAIAGTREVTFTVMDAW